MISWVFWFLSTQRSCFGNLNLFQVPVVNLGQILHCIVLLASYMKWCKKVSCKLNSGRLISTSALHNIEKRSSHLGPFIHGSFSGIKFICTYKRIVNDQCTCTAIHQDFHVPWIATTSFCKMLIFFKSFLRILSSGINLLKVLGTKSSCVEDLKFL